MASLAGSKQRVVIGMGKTGLSCARYLRARGEKFIWLDTRQAPPQLASLQQEFPDIAMGCGDLDAGLLCGATEIVVSPGVSVQEPALQHAASAGASLVGDIELFVRATSKPVIAITGSNAKSTVTTLLGEMAVACGLRPGVGGNLGTPVLDMLADDASLDCYVLELSSFQLETTHSLEACAAVILNVSDDHMDRYDSLDAYAAAKQRIYHHARHVVVNRADAMTHWQESALQTLWSFGLDAGDKNSIGVKKIGGEDWLVRDGETAVMRVADVRLAGKHNLANVAAAFALAAAAGWNLDACVDVVKVFAGLPHRCQWVAERKGVRFYNDSKGTNIGATIAAIEGLVDSACRNIVLIAGGDGKGADFSQLAPAVLACVKVLVLIGRDAGLIATACQGVQQVIATSMHDAVQKAYANATVGDVVLLSPACASFDMFTGYDDRGRQFCAAVEALV
ncbi:MAG TPA: UDP-N-acetylmuramoyl-L-alanine--D-glutamate ligase [Pseudomonadales bacterium]|nr:UDP-N-acetylmuramoyl-L-alanine--D-glutamate ligase [Pseudomonadales bacterium]